MTKPTKPLASKERKKPRGRNGGRAALTDDEKREQANFYLPRWLLAAFKKLIPAAADRTNLLTSWVRAYVIAGGESDRLLAQSPLAAELLAYLEATDAPEHLRDQLESLILQRASDEIKIAEGVVQVGDSLIVC